MTCIVGIADQKTGSVFIGGDSASVEGWMLQTSAPKVFYNHPFVAGYTTSFRMGQLLQYRMRIDRPSTVYDLNYWMVDSFIPRWQETLKDNGWLKTKDGREEGGEFLIGLYGRLFIVSDDFQVQPRNYCAVGCGAEIALGSLFTTESMNKPSKERVHIALQAAEAHSAGVRGPMYYMELTKEGQDIFDWY